MTETELTDRLREAIVLDGPDAWRSNGYLQEAQAAGLTLEEALKQADRISQEVGNNSLLFGNIQARIARLAQPARSHLIEQDLAQIVNAARSLNLSPDFVRNRWVPNELARLKKTPATPLPDSPIASSPPTPVASPDTSDLFDDLIEHEPVRPAPVVRVSEPEPQVELPEISVPTVPQPAPPVMPEPEPYSSTSSPGPSPVVHQFTATPARIRRGQTVMLEWAVDNLLAVTIDDLGEGLSPKNRGWIKPQKTADYTLFDANNNPLSTVRVDVIPRDRSGIYGVLFALALLAVIYWFIRTNNAQPTDPKSKRRTERTTNQQTTNQRTKTTPAVSRKQPREDVATTEASDLPAEVPRATPSPSSKSGERPAKPVQKPTTDNDVLDEPVTKPATPADARQGKYKEAFGDKPYDKIELGTDERGWRRARSNGRWGYINEADEWVIQPEYDAVTPFRGNTAGAFLNGQLITINRAGEQVRN